MIVSKWLVDEKLAQNSSLHFELISTILELMHCEIRMKMLIKIKIQVASHFFLLEHWIYDKNAYLNLFLLQFPNELLK